jgi:hypothetical protein
MRVSFRSTEAANKALTLSGFVVASNICLLFHRSQLNTSVFASHLLGSTVIGVVHDDANRYVVQENAHEPAVAEIYAAPYYFIRLHHAPSHALYLIYHFC